MRRHASGALLFAFAAAFTAAMLEQLSAQELKRNATVEIAPLTGQNKHDATVTSVAFSPDGSRLLTGDDYGEIRMWDAATGALLRTIQGERADVVAYSPDGSRVLAADDAKGDNAAALWDAATGKKLLTLPSPVRAAAFSPDGKLLITASTATVKLWNVATGALLRTFSGHQDEVNAVAFSPDGKFALSGSADKTMKLWNVSNGDVIRTFNATYDVEAMALSPDGSYAVTVATTKVCVKNCDWVPPSLEEQRKRIILDPREYRPQIDVWDVATAKVVRTFGDGGAGAIRSLAFAPDGATIVSCGWQIAQWNVATGSLVRKFLDESGCYGSSFSPDGARILASDDSDATLWDVASGKTLLQIKRRAFSLQSVAVSSDETQILPGDGENITRWSAARGELLQALKISPYQAIVFSPDGQRVLTGRSGDVSVWDASSGKLLRKIETNLIEIDSIALSPDGAYALIGCNPKDNKGAELYDLASGELVHALETGQGQGNGYSQVVSVAFSPDGSRMLAGSMDKTAKLWDTKTGELLRTFTGHTQGVSAVAFSPDGTRVLTGSEDSSAKLWDASTGELLQTFAGPEWVQAVAFTPDGVMAVVADLVATTLYDAATGKAVRSFSYKVQGTTADGGFVNEGEANALAVTRDGKRLLTGADDGAVRAWDVQTGDLIATLIKAIDGEWIAFTPEGFFDASNNGAKLVLFYSDGKLVPMDKAMAVLRRPDLVAAKLAGDSAGKVRAAAAALTFN